jgi:hypothetical protein
MAFRALRRTSAEIDEQHLAESDHAASRRRFLTRAATGGALAVGASTLPLSSLVPGAAAQTESGGAQPTSGTTPGTTAGTLPSAPPVTGDPPVVEGSDLTLVVFLQSIELSVIDAYEGMVATGKFAPAIAQTAREFTLHHTEHNAALGELSGGAAPTEPNANLTAELTPLIASATNTEDLATIAYTLEERVTATYAAALGALESWRAAAVASKILPVDSQHAIVWSQVTVPDTTEWATEITTWIPNFQSATDAIDIIQYPAS